MITSDITAAMLQQAPPGTQILLAGGSDHTPRELRIYRGTALYHPKHGWTEDHGETITPSMVFGERREVFLVEEM